MEYRSIRVTEKLYWDLRDLVYKKERATNQRVTISEVITEAIEHAIECAQRSSSIEPST